MARTITQFPPQPTSTRRSPLHPATSQGLRLGMLIAFCLGGAIAVSGLWQKWMSSPPQSGEVWVSGAKLPCSEAAKIIGAAPLTGHSIHPSPISPNLPQPHKSAPEPVPQPIKFPTGAVTTRLKGVLQGDHPHVFSLTGAKGQILTASLDGSSVVMSLLRSSQASIDVAAEQTRSWTGQLPADGEYLIRVWGLGEFTLDLGMTPAPRLPHVIKH